jgi:hypothetical protein
MENLKYPIGSFNWDQDFSLEELLGAVVRIQDMPNKLAKLLNTEMRDEMLKAQYREGSWTAQEVIHHLADSHMQAFVRCKHILAKTADTVQPYDENAWSQTGDYEFSYESSYLMLMGLHQRWSLLLLNALKGDPSVLAASLYHPERRSSISLAQFIALYAWHGDHHLAHIQLCLNSANNLN